MAESYLFWYGRSGSVIPYESSHTLCFLFFVNTKPKSFAGMTEFYYFRDDEIGRFSAADPAALNSEVVAAACPLPEWAWQPPAEPAI